MRTLRQIAEAMTAACSRAFGRATEAERDEVIVLATVIDGVIATTSTRVAALAVGGVLAKLARKAADE